MLPAGAALKVWTENARVYLESEDSRGAQLSQLAQLRPRSFPGLIHLLVDLAVCYSRAAALQHHVVIWVVHDENLALVFFVFSTI